MNPMKKIFTKLLAVSCMLLLGVGSSYAQWLRVAAGTTWDDNYAYIEYTTNTSDITLPNQGSIGNKSAGTISYDSNANKLTFNNVHRTSVTSSHIFFNYTGSLTVELIGENELNVDFTGLAPEFFKWDIRIVGSGSLKLGLSKYNDAISAVRNIDMRGSGVVDIELRNTNTNFSKNYPAASVDIQEGMMVLRATDKPTNLSDENMLSYVYTKDGGLHYKRDLDIIGGTWLRIEPLKKFNLYVAGQQANWINRADILGDGHVSYNLTENQLRLKDANINYEFNGGDDKTSIIQYSAADVANEHISGVEPSTFKVLLVGNNTITGVANASLATFHGFMQNCTFRGSGNLQMNMSANVAVSNGVFAFGYRYGTTEAVTLDPSFTGWVSATCSNVGNNPASVFERANDELRLPSTGTDGFFIAKGNILPTVAQTPATTNTNLNVAHVNFGKADGSPQATLRLINSDTFLGTNYVGKELSATIGCALQAMGGQAPFYYTAANLPGGLSINPETGVISGTYTTANSLPNPQVTLTATDLQGRQTTMSINQPWVYGKMTTDNSSLTGLQWTRNVAIPSINLSSLITNGAAPYTFTVLAPNPLIGNTRLPAGVLLSSDGVISGTPTGGGNFKTAIQVTDAIGQVAGFVLEGHIDANYDFRVAGTLVTSSNMNDIPVTGKTQGTISYDSETETLTFDNVRAYTTSASTPYFVDSKISKINVVGDNRITYLGTPTSLGDVPNFYGFPGNLDIYGDGKLNFRSGRLGENSIAVKGDVTIKDDATILLSSYTGAINGTLSVPMNQVIYTANTTSPSVADNQWEMLYNEEEDVNDVEMKYVKTERLENGALRFAEDFQLPEFLISIPMRINLADYVAGGVAPYSYNVTGLPSGISFNDKGIIWGIPDPTSEAVSNVVITVTDDMGRSITMTERSIVVHPDINYHIYGGNAAEVSGTVHDWWYIDNMDLGGANRLMYVDFPWDTDYDLNTNVIARDADGNWWAREIELTDKINLNVPEDVMAESITYTRTNVAGGKSQALYLPFDVIYKANLKNVAKIMHINNVHAYEDANGNISSMTVESLTLPENGLMLANMPYMFKMNETGDITLTAENTTLHATEDLSYTCSSFMSTFTFTGLYNTTMGIADVYALQDGQFKHFNSLNSYPFRFYFAMSEHYDVYGEPVQGPAYISVMIDGELDTEELTGIENVEAEGNAELHYDILGRSIDTDMPGIHITSDGKKYIVK